MSSNFYAIQDFKNNAKSKVRHGNDAFKYHCLVIYQTKNGTVNDVIDVFVEVAGYDPMIKLDVFDNGNLINSDNHHMNFKIDSTSTKIQYYRESKELIIQGNTKKVGKYEVRISEHH